MEYVYEYKPNGVDCASLFPEIRKYVNTKYSEYETEFERFRKLFEDEYVNWLKTFKYADDLNIGARYHEFMKVYDKYITELDIEEFCNRCLGQGFYDYITWKIDNVFNNGKVRYQNNGIRNKWKMLYRFADNIKTFMDNCTNDTNIVTSDTLIDIYAYIEDGLEAIKTLYGLEEQVMKHIFDDAKFGDKFATVSTVNEYLVFWEKDGDIYKFFDSNGTILEYEAPNMPPIGYPNRGDLRVVSRLEDFKVEEF